MRWRTSVTLLVLVLVVAGAGWYGWQQFRAPVDSSFGDSDCTEQRLAEGSRLTSAQVQVNVFNAGNREGLASETLDRFERQGFRGGQAENAPTGIRVDTVAIYDGDPTSAQVSLVKRQLSGRVAVNRRPDILDGIDVVVGSGFRGLDGRAPRSLRVQDAQQVCLTRAPGRGGAGKGGGRGGDDGRGRAAR